LWPTGTGDDPKTTLAAYGMHIEMPAIVNAVKKALGTA
jgi:hypothetical protein